MHIKAEFALTAMFADLALTMNPALDFRVIHGWEGGHTFYICPKVHYHKDNACYVSSALSSVH